MFKFPAVYKVANNVEDTRMLSFILFLTSGPYHMQTFGKGIVNFRNFAKWGGGWNLRKF